MRRAPFLMCAALATLTLASAGSRAEKPAAPANGAKPSGGATVNGIPCAGAHAADPACITPSVLLSGPPLVTLPAQGNGSSQANAHARPLAGGAAAPSSQPLPEPGGLALIALAAAGAWRARRARRARRTLGRRG